MKTVKRVMVAVSMFVLLSLFVSFVADAESWENGVVEAFPKEGLSMNHLFGIAGVAHEVTLRYDSAERNRAIRDSTRVYDWGDGSQTVVQSGTWEVEHTWVKPGIYAIRVDVELQDGASFSRSAVLAMFKTMDQQGFQLTSEDLPLTVSAPEGGTFGALLLWQPSLRDTGAAISYLAVNGEQVPNLFSGPYTSGVEMSYDFVYASQNGGSSLSLQVLSGDFARFTCSKATLYYLPAGPVRGARGAAGGIRPALGAPKF